MTAPYDLLDEMRARLRGMRGIVAEVAVEAAPLVEGVVRASAAAGTTVDGKPWPATRAGARALPNAASAVSAKAIGTTIVLTLTGPYVFHNSAEGKDRRRILPETGAGTPAPIADVIKRAAEKVFRRHAGARA